MIRKLDEKPRVYHGNEMPEAGVVFLYFELYSELPGVYGWAALDVRFRPFCLLHLEISKWGVKIFRSLQADWIFAKRIIKSLDCNVVVLTKLGNLSNQASYIKLIEKFGFDEPIEFTRSIQEI